MPTDLQSTRKLLLGSGGVRATLSHSLEETAAVSGLLPVATAALNDAVACLACDLPREAVELAHHARRFLSTSLARGEKPPHYFPELDEARRLVYLTLTSMFLPVEATILPSAAIVEHLERASVRYLDRHRLYFVIAGHADRLLEEQKLVSIHPLQIHHPDKFAYFLATSSGRADRESAIAGFLHRYGRMCLGLSDGLGTPVDLLSAIYAACLAQGRSPDAGRTTSILHEIATKG